MHSYIIELNPLEPFFFGGEHTFGKDESRQEDKARYFAKSEYFPQQSALLGMLRKAILNKKGFMTLHRNGEWVDNGYTHAHTLVGKEAFSYEKDFDIGAISSISPLFIRQDNQYYFVEPKDNHYKPYYAKGLMNIKGKVQKLICFEGYDPKVYRPTHLYAKSKDNFSIDTLFKRITTVGIKKSVSGKTEDNAFFLKQSYMFEKASFIFVLKSKEDMSFLDSTLVSLGADQSSFMLSIEKKEVDFTSLTQGIFEKKEGFDRIVLCSEMLMSADAYNLCSFVMGSRKTQRHLVAETSTKTKQKYKKSKRYYLFDRGTVLYTEDLEALESALKNIHLQKVGIGIYISIQGETDAQ